MYSTTFAALIATTHLSAGLFCLFVCLDPGLCGTGRFRILEGACLLFGALSCVCAVSNSVCQDGFVR